MTERTIAALIPPRLSGPLADRIGAAGRGGVPVVELPPLPRSPSLVYGMGSVDVDGRVTNKSVITALGWHVEDLLQVVWIGGSVLAHRSPAGTVRLGRKPYLVLPAVVRHRDGFGAGAQVLLAADPHHDVLVVHPLTALDTMINSYHAALSTVGSGNHTGNATESARAGRGPT